MIKQNKTKKTKRSEQEVHPSNSETGAEEKGYLCDSKKPLALDHSTTDPKGHRPDKRVNVVAAGRPEASLGWVLRRSKQAVPRQPTGPRLVQPTAHRLSLHTSFPSLSPSRHQKCWVDSIFSSSHKNKWCSFP